MFIYKISLMQLKLPNQLLIAVFSVLAVNICFKQTSNRSVTGLNMHVSESEQILFRLLFSVTICSRTWKIHKPQNARLPLLFFFLSRLQSTNGKQQTPISTATVSMVHSVPELMVSSEVSHMMETHGRLS